jgi:hypothetical protein
MTDSFPSDATVAVVEANIVTSKYAYAQISTMELLVDQKISFRVTTPRQGLQYIVHAGDTVKMQVINSLTSYTVKEKAIWTVHTGLAGDDCHPFESIDTPGTLIWH